MGFLKDLVNVGTGGLLNYIEKKQEQDLNQEAAREAVEKNRDISIEMFNLQRGENLAQWEREKSYAAEQWEKEKAYNLELWQRDAEYNAPVAQMQRLKEAGLNPRLMFDKGTVGNVTSPAAPGLEVPGQENPKIETPSMDTTRVNFGNGLMDWMEVKQAGLKNQNLSAETALIAANADYTREQARSLRRENEYFEKSGGSRWDPSWPRFLLRAGAKAGDWVDTNINSPVWQMMKDFWRRSHDYFIPVPLESWDGKAIRNNRR